MGGSFSRCCCTNSADNSDVVQLHILATTLKSSSANPSSTAAADSTSLSGLNPQPIEQEEDKSHDGSDLFLYDGIGLIIHDKQHI